MWLAAEMRLLFHHTKHFCLVRKKHVVLRGVVSKLLAMRGLELLHLKAVNFRVQLFSVRMQSAKMEPNRS